MAFKQSRPSIDNMVKENTSRAVPFKETRNKRLFEIIEDYTELIIELIETQGQVRVCDIARKMGISHVSVLKTVKRLVRDGYLEKNRGVISLTQEGEKIALFSRKKHLILSNFLLNIGVPEDIVATDVEGIEHYVSPTTLEAINAHLQSWLH